MRSARLSSLRESLLSLLRLQLDSTDRDILTVLAGHGLRLTLGLLSSAMLARALGPAALGVFAVIGAVIMIAVTMGDFGLSQSTVRYMAGDVEKQPEQAMRLSQAYVFLKLLGTILVVSLGFLLARPISIWLHLPPESGPLIVRLGIIGVAATAVSGMVSTLLQALRRFALLVAAQSVNITLTVLLMAALFFTGRLTITSALLIGIVTALAAAIVSISGTPAYWKRALLPVYRWPTDRARRLWGFGRWLWLSAILSILLLQLDLLLVNRLTSPVEAGYYALALNLALKADVLNQTIYLVLLPQVSALTNQAQMSSYVRRSMARGVGLALLLLPVLFLAGPFIVLVYGQTYAQTVPLFLGLLLIVAFDLLVQPLLLLAYPLDMPRAIAGAHVVRVATLLLAGGLLIPFWGGFGAVAAKLLAKVIGALLLGALLLVRIRKNKAFQEPDQSPLP